MQREAHRPPPSLLAPRPCEPPTAGWCQCTAIGKLLLRSGRRLCIEHLKKYKTCTRSQLMPGASPAADARAGACRRRPRHRRRRQPFLPPCTLTRSISFRTNPLEEAIQQISRPPKAFAKGLTAAESPASRRYLHSHRPPQTVSSFGKLARERVENELQESLPLSRRRPSQVSLAAASPALPDYTTRSQRHAQPALMARLDHRLTPRGPARGFTIQNHYCYKHSHIVQDLW